MKKLKTCAFCALLLLCSILTKAQDQRIPINEPDYNKPKLFADLPSKMILRIAEMEPMFKLETGATVAIRITENFSFEGTVVSKAHDASVKSIVIRSTNRPGASFTFTKVTVDGTDKYIGRIMSRNNSDVYEIAKEEGNYVLVKKDLYDVINE